jgi:hypothetical protein
MTRPRRVVMALAMMASSMWLADLKVRATYLRESSTYLPESSAAQPAPRGLDALTVPPDRLPGGCQLEPPPEGGRVGSSVTIVPAMLAVNPWIGDDRRIVASISSRLHARPRVPDGQPLDPRGASRYELKWADGVRDAYRASYVSEDLDAIQVDAVRLDDGTIKAQVFARDTEDSCFQAIRNHVQSVK